MITTKYSSFELLLYFPIFVQILRISEDKSKATNTHYLMSATAKLESDEISQEKYDFWRYKCPELDTTQI